MHMIKANLGFSDIIDCALLTTLSWAGTSVYYEYFGICIRYYLGRYSQSFNVNYQRERCA